MMDETKAPYYDPTNQVAVCPAQDNMGYESNAEFEKPPTAPPIDEPTHERMPPIDLGFLSDEDLREVCLEYAKQNCCYGSRFVRKSTLADILNATIYHYQLETYGEKRETLEKTEPFTGQYIDGPNNGPAPGPWDIPVHIAKMFVNAKATVEIPHTAYVKECYRCVGNCRIRCESCSGQGGSNCWACWGSGRSGARQCTSCGGSGRHRCWNCSGLGQVKCTICDGRGSLRHYRVLIVNWLNHVESYVTDTWGLKKELILEAHGKDIYNEENTRVFPLTNAPDNLVNKASKLMIEKHSTAFPQEFIRQQRHKLRVVPFTKATYYWKRKKGDFYVYGLEKKIHFDDYPQKCCCCTCC